jgi:hypothetical protein
MKRVIPHLNLGISEFNAPGCEITMAGNHNSDDTWTYAANGDEMFSICVHG